MEINYSKVPILNKKIMPNHKIKVSVIVPVYNVEAYLRKSILSIINQTLKEIEIILIDDGSTDTSLAIMKELAREDYRIKIFSQPNHGQSIARNIGLVNAVGEYIYFFDSDDILEEKTLEDCYNKCESQQLDFLFFDADVFSDDNISIGTTTYNRTSRFIDKIYNGIDLLQLQLANDSYSASVCLTFIKKQYLDSINLYFYPRIIHEDELFALILYIRAKRIGLINKIYFHRRVRPNSTMTTNFGSKNVIGYLTVCRELRNYLYQYDITSNEKKIINHRISILISSVLYRLSSLSLAEQKKYKEYIKKEFHSFLNIRMIITLYLPYIYDILKSIKHQGKKIFFFNI